TESLSGTNTGSYHQDWSFNNANYQSIEESGTLAFTIGKASSTTTTVGAGPFTYTGTAQVGGSGTVAGAGGLSTSATSLIYSANSDGTGTADEIDAGTYYVTAHYDGDTNHFGSDGSAVAIIINKVTPSVSVTDAGGTYTGKAFAVTAAIV